MAVFQYKLKIPPSKKHHNIIRGGAESLCRRTQHIKFTYYVMFRIVSAKISMVPLHEVVSKLPNNLCKRCSCVESTKDLFLFDSPLDGDLKWYNLTVFESIVNEFGDEDCKERLKSYKLLLEEFIRSREVRNNNATEDFIVEIDDEWDPCLISGQDNCKEYIAITLLKKSPENLFFVLRDNAMYKLWNNH